MTSQRIGLGIKILIAVMLVYGVLSLLWLAIANLMNIDTSVLEHR